VHRCAQPLSYRCGGSQYVLEVVEDEEDALVPEKI
jgi:hypothetical protein